MDLHAFLSDTHTWVLVAFVLFVALVYKKVAGAGARVLDDRSHKIRLELQQASRLREEAEALLADYKQKQAHYMREAEAMLFDAKGDAATITANAEATLKATIEARSKLAIEKIEQEEKKALQDVRNHVVDIALTAAKNVIKNQMSDAAQKELLKNALADIERKIH